MDKRTEVLLEILGRPEEWHGIGVMGTHYVHLTTNTLIAVRTVFDVCIVNDYRIQFSLIDRYRIYRKFKWMIAERFATAVRKNIDPDDLAKLHLVKSKIQKFGNGIGAAIDALAS